MLQPRNLLYATTQEVILYLKQELVPREVINVPQ